MSKPIYWLQKNGTFINVEDMSHNHLYNSIKLFSDGKVPMSPPYGYTTQQLKAYLVAHVIPKRRYKQPSYPISNYSIGF
jgi:hypothetical protein